MKRLINSTGVLVILLSISIMGCKQTMEISKVDYSQPIETVLEPDKDGMVTDIQHGLKYSILPLQYAETGDTTSVSIDQVRMIRGSEGYYYITASNFKHVYVMAPEKGKLELEKKIKINEKGIEKPAFNQRNKYVQLLNRSNGETFAITINGIKDQQTNENQQEG